MDQKNVKERNVLTFDAYLKKQDKLLKAVEADEKDVEYGQKPIKAEDPYVRHNANVYRAAGIKYDDKIANTEDTQKAGHNPDDDERAIANAKVAAGEEKTEAKKTASKEAKIVADASGLVSNIGNE